MDATGLATAFGSAFVSAEPGHRAARTLAQIGEERLPFTLRIARTDEEIAKAVAIRSAAYGRHVPSLGELLRKPEPLDFEAGSAVLLAESKLDGSPLGTMRIQTNRFRKLTIEASVELPDWLQDHGLAEATRLGVAEGRIGHLVKIVLFKAYFLYCQQTEIDWLVIGARKPLDRQYLALLFRDVYPGGEYIPMRHWANIPHRVLAFEVATAEARWGEARHPLYEFVFRTRHPDLTLETLHRLGRDTRRGEREIRPSNG